MSSPEGIWWTGRERPHGSSDPRTAATQCDTRMCSTLPRAFGAGARRGRYLDSPSHLPWSRCWPESGVEPMEGRMPVTEVPAHDTSQARRAPVLASRCSPDCVLRNSEPQGMRAQCISSGDSHAACSVAPDGDGGPGADPCRDKGPGTCWPEVRPSSPIQGSSVLPADPGGGGGVGWPLGTLGWSGGVGEKLLWQGHTQGGGRPAPAELWAHLWPLTLEARGVN